MGGRLIWLTTTPRVPAGLLSWTAWQALRELRVLRPSEGHPLLPFLAEAGITSEPVETAEREPAQVAADLLAAAAAQPVVWLAGPEGDDTLGEAVARAVASAVVNADALDPAEELPELEVLPGSYDLPGARVIDLVALMDRLRSPGGCPWDARQTHRSLLPYLLEEAYETVEAIEEGADASLREELGDLLLQVVFHARIAEERPAEAWSLDDVATGIVTKLRGRHPHVFADASAPTAEHVETTWEQLKAAEKRRSSAVADVPLAQPALALAAKLQSRAEWAGVVVPSPAPAGEPEPADADALGALLFALVATARRHGWDPEAALRAAARRYREAVLAAEAARPPGSLPGTGG